MSCYTAAAPAVAISFNATRVEEEGGMELTKRIAMPPVRIPHSIVQLVGVDRTAGRPEVNGPPLRSVGCESADGRTWA